MKTAGFPKGVGVAQQRRTAPCSGREYFFLSSGYLVQRCGKTKGQHFIGAGLWRFPTDYGKREK